MLNIEKYKKEVIARLETCQMERMIKDITGFDYCGSARDHCTPCAEYVYKWLLSEYKEPILNDAEKEYLSAVIKPFRKKVNHITKIEADDSKNCFIRITVNTTEHVNLPFFNTESDMYKGMMSFRSYTPQELGL